MKFILATKEEMTQVFDKDGRVHPATILKVGPMTVTQVKTLEKDGYRAVQVGYGAKKESHVHKAQRTKGLFRHFCEYRFTDDVSAPEAGSTYGVADAFAPGDVVAVSGISKAKGFQGVIKRHGFSGGPASHGQKHNARQPGSIGGGLRTRVPKGMRMAGRTGGTRVTVKNLKVLAVDNERGQLILEGAVPGRRGTLIEVRAA